MVSVVSLQSNAAWAVYRKLSTLWKSQDLTMLADLKLAGRRLEETCDMFRIGIIIPIAGLTVFFPFLMNFTAKQVVGYVQQYGANLLATRFIPFLLMIVGFFPITVSLVIALESFAGESERHSIEPLLSSPLTDLQLYLGKLLASLVPPIWQACWASWYTWSA
jgi:ABC-type transport system involved in multi-copper enzyme maturation permease subunit